MSFVAIILLILLGIILFLVEFLLVPGITIAGIGGALCMGGGVFVAYKVYGSLAGNLVLLGTLLFIIITVYFSLKSKTWKKFMLNSKIDGKVNVIQEEKINEGDVGKTITRLAPIGRVMVNDISIEAKSTGAFIDENTEIEVVKVEKSKIIVKLKT